MCDISADLSNELIGSWITSSGFRFPDKFVFINSSEKALGHGGESVRKALRRCVMQVCNPFVHASDAVTIFVRKNLSDDPR